ncbi:hypothetical protein D9613_006176 [Agrocybe pediades]|uniref:Uncharacterized protein n=1 Tax=Agrocybe pediades TaxID=84607 RepID=A0A8H4QU13_9AGAR|nr:hypothetical protein D9613_006176 [Agrocybe pediades]
MAEMSLRETFTDVGHSSGKRKRSSSPDEGSAPTPKRQLVVAPGQAAPIAMFENAKNVIINGGHFVQTFSMPILNSLTSDIKPQLSTTPRTPAHNISDIYQRNMAPLRAGTALWIPEGHSNLWPSYQDRGVCIGDVGTVTASGSFSFLFNICLPADHPVNRNLVPPGFRPIYPAIEPWDIREINEFMPWDYLSTDSIRKLANNLDDSISSAPLVSFRVQEGDGAVVVMPEGAISQDLENVSIFRSYAAANLEKWYRYVNVTRGREIENGELRLVIGCDKTGSWAIAAVPEQNNAATIQLRAEKIQFREFSLPYAWHVSGSVQTRVGPVCSSNLPGAANAPQKLNQCLFVRTMNLKLGTKEWGVLTDPRSFCLSSPTLNGAGERYVSFLTPDSMGERHASSNSSYEDADRTDGMIMESMLREHRRSASSEPPGLGPPKPFKHALDLLHNIMLSMYPDASMAITEDDEFLHNFVFLDSDDSTSTPSHDQLVDRLKELYEIKYDGGK